MGEQEGTWLCLPWWLSCAVRGRCGRQWDRHGMGTHHGSICSVQVCCPFLVSSKLANINAQRHMEKKRMPKVIYKEILLPSWDTASFSASPAGTWILQPWACSLKSHKEAMQADTQLFPKNLTSLALHFKLLSFFLSPSEYIIDISYCISNMTQN